MITLDEKFRALEADNAPGQEVRQDLGDLDAIMRGGKLEGQQGRLHLSGCDPTMNC